MGGVAKEHDQPAYFLDTSSTSLRPAVSTTASNEMALRYLCTAYFHHLLCEPARDVAPHGSLPSDPVPLCVLPLCRTHRVAMADLASMTPGTRSRHAYMGVLEPWIIKQKKVFTSWVNQKAITALS